MILILTQFEDDPSVQRIVRILRDRGDDPLVVSTATLERPSTLLIANDPNGGTRSILRLDHRSIDMAEVQTAWLWRGWQPDPLQARLRPVAARPALRAAAAKGRGFSDRAGHRGSARAVGGDHQAVRQGAGHRSGRGAFAHRRGNGGRSGQVRAACDAGGSTGDCQFQSRGAGSSWPRI